MKLEPQRKREFRIAGTMLASSAVVLFISLHIHESNLLHSGTRILPVTASLLMLIFSCIRCLFTLQFFRQLKFSTPSPSKSFKLFIITALLVVYSQFLETAGFPIATVLLLIAFVPLLDIKKPSAILALSVGVTISIWILFTVIFGGYLPSGYFF